MKRHCQHLTLLLLVFTIVHKTACACSMYKVTVNGKTMVGNNEDSWGRDACIWFEPGTNGSYGLACVGYARKRPNPDGALNERGLAFDAFTMPHLADLPPKDPKKKDFSYADIRSIMQHCSTVDEVYNYLKDLNLHVLNGSILFNGGMLLFADPSGKYLVVEAEKMTLGNEANFALANFSIARNKDLSKIQTTRYRKGIAFLSNKTAAATLSFCQKLSDTMSVNRHKIGDGTLYTNIYDLQDRLIHLYFYHDFSRRVTLDLKEELAKGPHAYTFPELFPNNEGFARLLNYQTPANNRLLFWLLLTSGILFLFSSLYFTQSLLKNPLGEAFYLRIGVVVLSTALSVYMYILLRNTPIFFFPAPYQDAHSVLVTITAYVPYLLAIAILPLLYSSANVLKKRRWTPFARYLLFTQCGTCLILLGLFIYWKLF